MSVRAYYAWEMGKGAGVATSTVIVDILPGEPDINLDLAN